MEIERGQRFNFSKRLNRCKQSQKEAQLAAFHRLRHNIDTVEILGEDSFANTIAAGRIVRKLLQKLAEMRESGASNTVLYRSGLIALIMFCKYGLHACQTNLVEWFQDVQRGQEKRASSAGGIEDGYVLNARVKSGKQASIATAHNDIPGETAQIEVAGNHLINRADLARDNPFQDFSIALASGNNLAPGFQWERVHGWRGLIPCSAERNVLYPGCYLWWQWDSTSMLQRASYILFRLLP